MDTLKGSCIIYNSARSSAQNVLMIIPFDELPPPCLFNTIGVQVVYWRDILCILMAQNSRETPYYKPGRNKCTQQSSCGIGWHEVTFVR